MHVDVARIFCRIEREVHRFIVYATNRADSVVNRVRSLKFSSAPLAEKYPLKPELPPLPRIDTRTAVSYTHLTLPTN